MLYHMRVTAVVLLTNFGNYQFYFENYNDNEKKSISKAGLLKIANLFFKFKEIFFFLFKSGFAY